MRLLLVEDDGKIAFFIATGLKEAGFAVDHVANGEDGLHMALNEPYDYHVRTIYGAISPDVIFNMGISLEDNDAYLGIFRNLIMLN